MAALEDHFGLEIVTPDPSEDGGLAINNNFKKLIALHGQAYSAGLVSLPMNIEPLGVPMPFQPGLVMSWSPDPEVQRDFFIRSALQSDENSFSIDDLNTLTLDEMNEFRANDLRLNLSSSMRVAGRIGHFLLLKDLPNIIKISTYVGNGGSGTRAIIGVGFQPEFVWVWNDIGGQPSRLRMIGHATNTSMELDGLPNQTTSGIRGFDADGFTISRTAAGDINDDGETYHYLALRSGNDGNTFVDVRTFPGTASSGQFINTGFGPDFMMGIKVGSGGNFQPRYASGIRMDELSIELNHAAGGPEFLEQTEYIKSITPTGVNVGINWDLTGEDMSLLSIKGFQLK